MRKQERVRKILSRWSCPLCLLSPVFENSRNFLESSQFPLRFPPCLSGRITFLSSVSISSLEKVSLFFSFVEQLQRRWAVLTMKREKEEFTFIQFIVWLFQLFLPDDSSLSYLFVFVCLRQTLRFKTRVIARQTTTQQLVCLLVFRECIQVCPLLPFLDFPWWNVSLFHCSSKHLQGQLFRERRFTTELENLAHQRDGQLTVMWEREDFQPFVISFFLCSTGERVDHSIFGCCCCPFLTFLPFPLDRTNLTETGLAAARSHHSPLTCKKSHDSGVWKVFRLLQSHQKVPQQPERHSHSLLLDGNSNYDIEYSSSTDLHHLNVFLVICCSSRPFQNLFLTSSSPNDGRRHHSQ